MQKPLMLETGTCYPPALPPSRTASQTSCCAPCCRGTPSLPWDRWWTRWCTEGRPPSLRRPMPSPPLSPLQCRSCLPHDWESYECGEGRWVALRSLLQLEGTRETWHLRAPASRPRTSTKHVMFSDHCAACVDSGTMAHRGSMLGHMTSHDCTLNQHRGLSQMLLLLL